jgi:hypothetical protein
MPPQRLASRMLCHPERVAAAKRREICSCLSRAHLCTTEGENPRPHFPQSHPERSGPRFTRHAKSRDLQLLFAPFIHHESGCPIPAVILSDRSPLQRTMGIEGPAVAFRDLRPPTKKWVPHVPILGDGIARTHSTPRSALTHPQENGCPMSRFWEMGSHELTPPRGPLSPTRKKMGAPSFAFFLAKGGIARAEGAGAFRPLNRARNRSGLQARKQTLRKIAAVHRPNLPRRRCSVH